MYEHAIEMFVCSPDDAVLRIPKMVVCALVATKRSKRSEKEPRNIRIYAQLHRSLLLLRRMFQL